MRRRPIIGIPTQTLHSIDGIPEGLPESWVMNQRYSRAVAAAGGLPVMIPLLEDEDTLRALYDRMDALLLPGGVDLDPATYGESPLPSCGRLDPARDRVELRFARWAIAEEKPLFGLCRGLQIVNVALGGTLYQDIAAQRTDAIKHDYFPTAGFARDHLAHRVTVAPGSRLDALVGAAPLEVNSMHHQGGQRPRARPGAHRGGARRPGGGPRVPGQPVPPRCAVAPRVAHRPRPPHAPAPRRIRRGRFTLDMADQTEQKPRIRLTAFSHGAGCACKLGPGELSEVLHHLPGVVDPRVLVDAATHDDAAVFRLSDDRALVATVDFFTPIVDDAAQWGAIAAANALSDVYAMGGTPLFALNLVGWPREKLPFELLGDVIRGASEVAGRAGCAIVGGHSIDSLEPLFGMVVMGEVHPDRMFTNAGACAGDVLVLTKPLGTGILTTALKRDALIEAGLADAVRSMTALNDGAAKAALRVGVSAATDVTGFGLLRHLGNMLAASKVAAEVAFESLPLLPHALNLAARGIVPGGTQRNLEAAKDLQWAEDLAPHERLLCVDAQTSGGLLLAVPPENEARLLEALREAETPAAAVIGRLVAGPAGHIHVTRRH